MSLKLGQYSFRTTEPLIRPSWIQDVPINRIIEAPQHGFSYIDENGTQKFFDPMEVHKYSNETLQKIYGIIMKEVDAGNITKEESEGLVESIIGQYNYRKLILKMFEMLRDDLTNPVNDFPAQE